MPFRLPWFRSKPSHGEVQVELGRRRTLEGRSRDDFRLDRADGYQGRQLGPGEFEIEMTPEERRRAVMQSRRVYNRCAAYGAIIDRLTDFVVGDGVVIKVEGDKAQKALDDVLNHPENKWHQFLKARTARWLIDGEFLWSVYSAKRGGKVRASEAAPAPGDAPEPETPDQEESATATAEIRIGRLTPDGIENVSVNALNHDRVKAVSYVHRAGEKPVMYPVAEPDAKLANVTLTIDAIDGGTQTVGPVMGAVALWRVNPLSVRSAPLLTRIIDKAFTLDEAIENAARKSEYVNRFWVHITYQKANDEARGEHSQDLKFEKKALQWATGLVPGAAMVTGKDVQVNVHAPDLKLMDVHHLYDILIGWIMGSHGFPRMWFADGGDTNRATAAEQGTPVYRSIRALQAYWASQIEDFARFLLWWLAESGVQGVTGKEKINVQCSDVATRDSERDVQEISGLALVLNELVSANVITEDERLAIGRAIVSSKSWGEHLDPKSVKELKERAAAAKAAGEAMAQGMGDVDPRNPVPDPDAPDEDEDPEEEPEAKREKESAPAPQPPTEVHHHHHAHETVVAPVTVIKPGDPPAPVPRTRKVIRFVEGADGVPTGATVEEVTDA